MPTIIDSLLVKLGLDSSEYNKGKADVEKGLKDTGKEADEAGKKLKKNAKDGADGFEKITKSVVKYLALIGSAAQVKRFVTDQIEANASLYRLSQNLNQNANDISAWSNATELAGGSADGLRGTMDMLSQSQTELQLTGESGLIPFFSALGLSLTDTKGKALPVNDLLLNLADRFSKMDRTTANNMGRMMGIDQGTLQMLLKGRSEVQLMISRQKEYGAVTKKQAEEATRLRNAMVSSRQSFEAFGRELLSAATPALEKIFSLFADFGAWVRSNKEFVQTFLTVLAAGLGAVALATIPISLTAVSVLALAAAVAALWQDYQVWKRGGDSLIDWGKWGPGIEAAGRGIKKLKDLLSDLIYREIAAIDLIGALFSGDWTRAKFAAGELISGSPSGEQSAPSKLGGIPGAAGAAAGAGAGQVAMANTQGGGGVANSVETHIGEVKVYTAATDAPGIANDMGKSLDYLFTSQANYGLF
jgi:hypothetical protein